MPHQVCIIILNWNQAADTLACLESLSNIVYQDKRLVVVDNGSHDDSEALIRRNYPFVEVFALRENIGCAGGRNTGLAFARSLNADFVLFLDNDTVVEPHFLCHLIKIAEANPDIGILTSKIVLHSDSAICWTAGGSIKPDGSVEALHYFAPADEIPDTVFYVDWVPGCVLLVRREVYEQIGGFDNFYSFYFEDIDFCVRASRLGYKIAVVPHSIVFHKVSQSLGGGYTPARLYYWSRNRLFFMQRQTRGLRRIITMGLMIAEDFKDGLGDIFLMKKPSCAKARWRGILHFFLQRGGNKNL